MVSPAEAPLLYAADAASLADAQLYARSLNAVSPLRRQKAERLADVRDRRLSIGAELLLRCALRDAGIGEFPLEFGFGPQGKPHLKDHSISFSLSHSGQYALCAVGACDVGCDVEKIRPIDLKLAKRFFAPSEYDDIAARPTPEAKTELFFRYWTLKESFMKATGLGLLLPMDEFQMILGDNISAEQTVDGRSYSFREFEDIPGYRCALCAAESCSDTHLHIIDLKDFLMSSVK